MSYTLNTHNPTQITVNPAQQSYLSASQVAKRLSLSRTSVWRYLRDDPDFPKPYRFGRTTRRWSLAEIIAWEQSRNDKGM